MPPVGKEKDKEQKPRRKPGRVPTSCAECRRLKLRCDRKVPCEKCVSRGCGSICPDGALTPGKGNKMILANTEELHDRIDQLSSRIRELEGALQTLQARVSNEPHPLLQKGILQSLHPPSTASRPSTTSSADPPPTPVTASKVLSPASSTFAPMDPNPPNVSDFCGTLVIHESGGRSTYFGPTARSELLTCKHDGLGIKPSRLPQELIDFAFPDSHPALEARFGEHILGLRPQLSEAVRLCDLYLKNGKVMYSPVPRSELMDEILMSVYRSECVATRI